MSNGWIDSNGEYREHYKVLTQKEKKKINDEKKERFKSLPISEQEVVKWCFQPQSNKMSVVRFAQVRMRMMDRFYREKENTRISIKKELMYEYAYNHFEEFKKFILTTREN